MTFSTYVGPGKLIVILGKLKQLCEDFDIAAYKMAVKNLLSEILYLENVTLASLADSHRNSKNANRRTMRLDFLMRVHN